MNRKRSDERDAELFSAYLDGQLSATERADLERRLTADPELQRQLNRMQQTIQVLRQAPAIRAPRKYTLDPVVYGRPAPWWRSLGTLRLATGLAMAVLVVAVAGVALVRFSSSGGPGIAAAPVPNQSLSD